MCSAVVPVPGVGRAEARKRVHGCWSHPQGPPPEGNWGWTTCSEICLSRHPPGAMTGWPDVLLPAAWKGSERPKQQKRETRSITVISEIYRLFANGQAATPVPFPLSLQVTVLGNQTWDRMAPVNSITPPSHPPFRGNFLLWGNF